MIITKNLYSISTKPSRVVILGSKGFIASELKTKLKDLDIKFLSLSKSEIDLTLNQSVEILSKIIQNEDVLIFISAEAPVKNNEMLMNNIIMSDNVTKSIKNINLSHLIYISSDAVYSDFREKINENSCASPTSMHGIMHITRETMISNSFKGPKCFIRPTLIYGFNDPHNGYGPNKFLRESSQNKDILLFGKGEELRDHVFIDDVIESIIKIILFKTIGIVNIVTGNVISFYDIAKLVVKNTNSKSKITFIERLGEMPHGGYRAFNNSALKKLFPDIKIHSLDEGLKKTIKFMNLSL